jgi:hypothetical protein
MTATISPKARYNNREKSFLYNSLYPCGMLIDPRYTLTDLYFLFIIKPDGTTVIKYLLTGARPWYTLMASLLFEGIIRGYVKISKQDEQFYVRLVNNRKAELDRTVSLPDDDLVNKMLWFLRKKNQPYLLSDFLSQGWSMLYPTRKLQEHLAGKSLLIKQEKKRLFGLWKSASYPVLDTELHTTLRTKAEAVLARADTTVPTLQEIVFLSLMRGSGVISHLFPHLSISDEMITNIIHERTEMLRSYLRSHPQSDSNVGSSLDIGLPVSEEIIASLLDKEEQFAMLTDSLNIMIDTLSIAMEGVDSFGDGGGSDGGDGGGDGGGGGGGGE